MLNLKKNVECELAFLCFIMTKLLKMDIYFDECHYLWFIGKYFSMCLSIAMSEGKCIRHTLPGNPVSSAELCTETQ